MASCRCGRKACGQRLRAGPVLKGRDIDGRRRPHIVETTERLEVSAQGYHNYDTLCGLVDEVLHTSYTFPGWLRGEGRSSRRGMCAAAPAGCGGRRRRGSRRM